MVRITRFSLFSALVVNRYVVSGMGILGRAPGPGGLEADNIHHPMKCVTRLVMSSQGRFIVDCSF